MLVERLQELLPEGKRVSIDISARTRTRDYRRAGYHLTKLAGSVDLVQLMAYDTHGPWSGPGPSGPKPGPGEWRATLSNGTVIWWSDRRSFAKRLDLAGEYDLHGLSLIHI